MLRDGKLPVQGMQPLEIWRESEILYQLELVIAGQHVVIYQKLQNSVWVSILTHMIYRVLSNCTWKLVSYC